MDFRYPTKSKHYQELYELLQELRLWHELLTLGLVKVTRGYINKLTTVSLLKWEEVLLFNKDYVLN